MLYSTKRIVAAAAIGSFLLLAACQSDTAPDTIIGEWQAAKVVEAGDSLAIDPAEIGFIFTADGRYRYRSTLNYREAGRYRVKNRLLFTTDTLQADGKEKAVAIEQLSPDSLTLKMMQEDKERRVVLIKQ